MQTGKRLLSVLLSLLLVVTSAAVCAVPAGALNASGQCGENVTYTFDASTGLLEISGTGAMTDFASGASPFSSSAIRTIRINEGVTRIGDFSFISCSNLTDVSFPGTLTVIGRNAFWQCSGLTGVTFPAGLTEIGNAAFLKCSGLTSVTLPAGLTDISDYVFSECSGLTSVTLPAGLTEIGAGAFSQCSGLTSVTFPASLNLIDKGAFAGCSGLTGVTIPAGLRQIGSGIFQDCAGLTAIAVDAGNAYFSADEDGVLFDKDKTNLIQFPAGSGITDYTVPDTVERLAQDAFYGCNRLTHVTLQFGVTYIGHFCFWECSNLTAVSIPSSVIEIGMSVFQNCKRLTSIRIPDGVHIIYESSFAGSGLRSVTIPASVTKIEKSAFKDCNLRSVYYKGSELDWYKINIGANNELLQSAALQFDYVDPDAAPVTIVVSPEEGGTASESRVYYKGERATLTAAPNEGYRFNGWFDGISNICPEAEYAFTVTQAITLTAQFRRFVCTVTVQADEGGTVTGGGRFFYGEDVTVQATPGREYTFAGWYFDGENVSDSESFTFSAPDQDVTLTAKFAKKIYSLDVKCGPSKFGSAVVLTEGVGGGSDRFESGTEVTVKAEPKYGYHCVGWYDESGSPVSSDNPYTFAICGNTTLTARFEPDSFTVTVTAGTGGTATGGGEYLYSDSVTLTAVPDRKYRFVGWIINGGVISSDPEFTFTVSMDLCLEAQFEQYIFDVDLYVDGYAAGYGSVSGGGAFYRDDEVTVTAVPGEHWHFVGWYDRNGQLVSDRMQYSFSVSEDVSLTARFDPDTGYAVVRVGTNNWQYGSADGEDTYAIGSEATVTAAPRSAYSFVRWEDENGRTVSTDAVYTFTVQGDTDLTAVFALRTQYNVMLDASAGGTASGGGRYYAGDSVVLTAAPDEGYHFVGWYDAFGQLVSDETPYTFTVRSNVAFTAQFERDARTFFVTVSANPNTFGTVTGGGVYAEGAEATVTAVPAAPEGQWAFLFVSWRNGRTGEMVSTDAVYTFTVTEDTELEAVFENAAARTVTVSAGDGGTAAGGGIYAVGTQVTVTATPLTGYTFTGWYSGSGMFAQKISTDAAYTFTVTNDVTLTAKFEAPANAYVVTLTAGEGGTVSGGGAYAGGTSVTVTAKPDKGYRFLGWYGGFGGSQKISGDAVYTFTVTKDVTLKAKFESSPGGWSFTEDSGLYIYEGGSGVNYVCGLDILYPVISDFIETTGGWSYEVEVNEFGLESTGAKLTIYDENGDAVEEYYTVLFGDINGDGGYDLTDVSLLMDAMGGNIDDEWTVFFDTDEFPQSFAADPNHDLTLDLTDVGFVCDQLGGEDIDQSVWF